MQHAKSEFTLPFSLAAVYAGAPHTRQAKEDTCIYTCAAPLTTPVALEFGLGMSLQTFSLSFASSSIYLHDVHANTRRFTSPNHYTVPPTTEPLLLLWIWLGGMEFLTGF